MWIQQMRFFHFLFDRIQNYVATYSAKYVTGFDVRLADSPKSTE